MLRRYGMGDAQEYHMKRYLRESLMLRVAPVSPLRILNVPAEKDLGFSKSY